MSAARWIAAGLLLVEAAAYYLVARNVVLAAAAVLCAAIALAVPPRLQLNRRQAGTVVVVLGLCSGIPHWLGLYPDRFLLNPLAGPVLFLADLAVLLQAVLLLSVSGRPMAVRSPEPSRSLAWPEAFLCLGIVALTGAGAGRANGQQQTVFGAISVLYAIGAALLITSNRSTAKGVRPGARTRGAAWFLLLALAMAMAGGGSHLIAEYGNRFDSMLVNGLVNSPSLGFLGFSRSATLGSIQEIQAGSELVALRAYSLRTPGYLRGCVYDTYAEGRWSSAAEEQTVESLGSVPPELHLDDARPVFPLRGAGAGPFERMDLWLDPRVANTFFLPNGATYAAAAAEKVFVDDYGAAHPRDLDPESPVSIWFAQEAARGGNTALPAVLLDVPVSLDPQVREIAANLFVQAPETSAKAAAVERYFREHYRYQLGISVPKGIDPLNYFLLERPAAHCEYFAAGALTLLRLGGVPCRYVTGFVVHERDPLDNAWIARNRDAHAWVEAWDAARGWFIVEATPPGGVPHGAHQAKWRYLRDYLAQRWRALKFKAAQLNWNDALWVLPPLLGVGLLIYTAQRIVAVWRNKRRAKKDRLKVSARVRVLHRNLRKQDRQLRAAGFVREAPETLHQFATRIEREKPELQHHAEWYRSYAARRYDGD